MRLVRKRRGFTNLMELVVTTAVSIVFILFSSVVMLTSFRNWHINHTVTTVHEDILNALRHMIREIREAGATSPLGIGVSGPDSSALNFQIPETVSAETGPTSWQSIQYSLGGSDGKRLIRTDADGSRELATNVADLSFSYNPSAPQVVGVSIRGERASADDQVISRTLNSEVTVRN